MAQVKIEMVDSLVEDQVPPHKRHKFQRQKVGRGGFARPASLYSQLDEPSPLGLRLRKSQSLLELIQFKLSQGNMPKVGDHCQSESKGGASSVDKMKASNFPASVIKIGTWEYKSRYEGDLVAKCYFAKHKLVWEVLDGGLKNKIEIQWSGIIALKAKYMDDCPGALNVTLARQPLFFRETNPQPRKHTLWQATFDFTGGQASIHRQHFLEFPHGLLGKHFEKLVQCDPQLHFLSQQEEVALASPYFEPKLSILDDRAKNDSEVDMNNHWSPSFFSIQDATSPSGAQSSSSKNDQYTLGRHLGSCSRDSPSPCLARDGLTVANMDNGGVEQLKALNKWDQIMVPGLRSSMSMSDLVSHLENRISEQGTSNNPDLLNEDWQSLQILDDISRCLFSDSQSLLGSDEKTLMSRVNSLCCILQKDTAVSSSIESANEKRPNMFVLQKRSSESNTFGASSSKSMVEENQASLDDEFGDTSADNKALHMPKTDSVGDLLLNLPRIASLPQLPFNISEDFENQAR